ncbi:hypothetical protein KAFR_0B00280 [Kazachstania africana CBS 2517]|uniref:C2H2-type domain-containing protein n=1 Tax=Kazachstania africana (strain ATCC 22294 / BCRC 22015 / CBS 2517 / CECT 1963 / NBRC 1671 / NRRL Y-8276) TaxID=1071382 RepID=H2APM8_KAZAF|nr:hypothetical protein KAFR_0B00280 [Kazachstania africana CBS 2517]CCF56328.1 hypothetical protein KAFR_0B00280 [Kazachstania africana CBS 2517]
MSSDEEYIYESDHDSGHELKNELNSWEVPIRTTVPSASSLTPRRSRSSSVGSTSTTSSSRPKNYLCDYDGCAKAFTRPSLLTEHQQTIHHGIKSFKCNECTKSFARKTHLERHLISHLNDKDKPFHCKYCNKGTTTRQQLKRHEITHTKSFHCPYKDCDESFHKHPQLRSHILSLHEKKLACKHCGKHFQRPYRLNSHIQKHHNPNVENPYSCSFSGCLQSFRTWTQLTLHIKNDHPKLQCPVCQKFVVGESGLQMHMKIHDDSLVSRNWKCKHCVDGSFQKKSDLISHFSDVHPGLDLPVELTYHPAITLPELKEAKEDYIDDFSDRLNEGNTHLEEIEQEIKLNKFLNENSSMKLLLNTVGRKLTCPFNKCYRTFKTQERYDLHIEKHKIHQLKLKLLEEKKEAREEVQKEVTE